MASRIEDIFLQLVRLFKKVRGRVGGSPGGRIPPGKIQDSSGPGPQAEEPRVTGTVDLRVVKAAAADVLLSSSSAPSSQVTFRPGETRTSQSQILNSLINLLLAILNNVTLTLDTGDEIMSLMLPLMTHRQEIREALVVYNEDAVWLWDIRLGRHTVEIDVPVLRPKLHKLGLELGHVIV
jgi:hypothetical protein